MSQGQETSVRLHDLKFDVQTKRWLLNMPSTRPMIHRGQVVSVGSSGCVSLPTSLTDGIIGCAETDSNDDGHIYIRLTNGAVIECRTECADDECSILQRQLKGIGYKCIVLATFGDQLTVTFVDGRQVTGMAAHLRRLFISNLQESIAWRRRNYYQV